MKETFAVITGASQGLGKSFAQELAQKKINLILISLPNEGLSDLCKNFQEQFGIRAVHYETDLSTQENVLTLAHWINENYAVKILINNAGVGDRKSTRLNSSHVRISYAVFCLKKKKKKKKKTKKKKEKRNN